MTWGPAKLWNVPDLNNVAIKLFLCNLMCNNCYVQLVFCLWFESISLFVSICHDFVKLSVRICNVNVMFSICVRSPCPVLGRVFNLTAHINNYFNKYKKIKTFLKEIKLIKLLHWTSKLCGLWSQWPILNRPTSVFS